MIAVRFDMPFQVIFQDSRFSAEVFCLFHEDSRDQVFAAKSEYGGGNVGFVRRDDFKGMRVKIPGGLRHLGLSGPLQAVDKLIDSAGISAGLLQGAELKFEMAGAFAAFVHIAFFAAHDLIDQVMVFALPRGSPSTSVIWSAKYGVRKTKNTFSTVISG